MNVLDRLDQQYPPDRTERPDDEVPVEIAHLRALLAVARAAQGINDILDEYGDKTIFSNDPLQDALTPLLKDTQ